MVRLFVPEEFGKFLRSNLLALSPGPSQILSRNCGEKSGEGLGLSYVTDQKWWTQLVQTQSTLRIDRVHHFRSMT